MCWELTGNPCSLNSCGVVVRNDEIEHSRVVWMSFDDGVISWDDRWSWIIIDSDGRPCGWVVVGRGPYVEILGRCPVEIWHPVEFEHGVPGPLGLPRNCRPILSCETDWLIISWSCPSGMVGRWCRILSEAHRGIAAPLCLSRLMGWLWLVKGAGPSRLLSEELPPDHRLRGWLVTCIRVVHLGGACAGVSGSWCVHVVARQISLASCSIMHYSSVVVACVCKVRLVVWVVVRTGFEYFSCFRITDYVQFLLLASLVIES